MNEIDFLNQIKPGLTFGSVSLIFSLGAFKAAQIFWEMEKNSATENIDRVRELSGQFKSQFIEPILIGKTREWVGAAYDEAIELVKGKVFVSDGKGGKKYDGREGAFSSLKIAEYKAELRKNDKVQGFFSSKEGGGILDKLDKQYLRVRDFVNLYHKHIVGLRNSWILSSVIASLLFLGLIKFLIDPLPPIIVTCWLVLIIVTFSLNIFFAISSEYYRRKIHKIWADYQINGRL